MNVPEDLRKKINIIWIVMMVVPVIILVISFLLPQETLVNLGRIVFDNSQFQSPQVKQIMASALIGFSVVISIIGILFRKLILSDSKIFESSDSDEIKAQKWLQSHILAYALFEAVSILGFFVVSMKLKMFGLGMMVMSFILLLAFKPKK